jgi:hypothetical protein
VEKGVDLKRTQTFAHPVQRMQSFKRQPSLRRQNSLMRHPSMIKNKDTFWGKFVQKPCLKIIRKRLFKDAVIVAILTNTTTLAMDRFDIEPQMEAQLGTANFALYWFFVFEMTVKVLGMGPRLYTKDMFNLFDGVVVLISTVELASTGHAM